MTMREFVQWMAFYSICPFGTQWIDKSLAHQTMLVLSRISSKMPEAVDFSPRLPVWRSAEAIAKDKAIEELAILRGAAADAAAYNKKKGIKG